MVLKSTFLPHYNIAGYIDWLPSYVQYLPIISCPITKTFFLVTFTSLLMLESYVLLNKTLIVFEDESQLTGYNADLNITWSRHGSQMVIYITYFHV